jgi:WG containing repeat
MNIMRLFAAMLLSSLLHSATFAQLEAPPRIEPAGPPLFVITVKGKDGFMNQDGKIIIEPVFEKALPFSDGLAAVLKQGLWGFIDTSGRVVIEPKFISVSRFSDGLAAFQQKRWSDKEGYIDKTGKVVIEPQFDVAEPFHNGLARVGFGTVKGRLLSLVADVGVECEYKFIDRTGKVVPEPSPLHYATGEPGELIPFRKDGLAGYLNAKGEVVIEPQFQFAAAFSEDLALACKDKLLGFINKRGEWAIPPRFEYAGDFSEGLAGVSLGEAGWGFIDRTGKVVIEAKFVWVYQGFRHGLAEITLDGKSTYINKQGEHVGPPGE